MPPVVTLKRFVVPSEYTCLFRANLTVNIDYFRKQRAAGSLLGTDRVFCEVRNKSCVWCRRGPGYLRRYSDSLRAGRSGDRIPVGGRYSPPIQTIPGAHTDSYTIGTGSFPEVKRPGRGIEHPPPSSAEVKERVVLYLYSNFGLSWPFLWWTLHLPLTSYDAERSG